MANLRSEICNSERSEDKERSEDMEPRRKKRKRKGTTEASSFMDTVRSAFIRWVALEKWREVEDLRATVGMELGQALEEAGQFPGRGRYQPLWVSRWKAEVSPEAVGADPGNLFAAIERAVAAAVTEEEAERKSHGDPPLDEDPEYKGFVDTALERLLGEGGGTLGTGS
jgi:hypothetical protein